MRTVFGLFHSRPQQRITGKQRRLGPHRIQRCVPPATDARSPSNTALSPWPCCRPSPRLQRHRTRALAGHVIALPAAGRVAPEEREAAAKPLLGIGVGMEGLLEVTLADRALVDEPPPL